MFRLSLKPVLAIVIGLVIAVHVPERVEARATVGDRELVSKTRAGRSEFLFTYRLTIDNQGPSLDDVNVWVLCENPGTTMVDEIAEFGRIEANTVVSSTGTFSLRQNRRVPFDPECLIYEIGFNTKLIISGIATDMPLKNALIVGKVTHPDSGRPIIESGRPIIEEFSTTADADGNFTLEMDTVMQEDFVTLEAEGVAEQEGATLTSTIGSVGSLQDVGADGSIVITSGGDITHITTALAVLAEIANGGPITTDGELALAQSQVDGAELLIMASVIKTVIDNPNVVLPPGVNSTLELVSNPAVFDDYVQFLEDNFQDEFTTAIVETSENLSTGYEPAEMPGTMYTVQRDELPLTGESVVFDFDANGNGNVIPGNGSSDTTWVINADGEIVVDLLNPPVTEIFPSCVFPGQTNSQCRALNFVERITIIRLVNGFTSEQVFVLKRTRTTFPDDPVPDEVIEDQPGPNAVRLAFRDAGILPVDPVDVAGDRIATYYYHQDNNSIGLNEAELGADFLTFNADGSGVTQRRAFAFSWVSNVDGSLGVQFDNGDSNRYVVYSEDGDVAQAILIGTLATGVTRTLAAEALDFDGVSEFSEPMLTDRRYRGLFAVFGQDEFFDGTSFNVFDYLFLPGGHGCRQTGTTDIPDAIGAQRFEWESTPENYMDLFRFSAFAPTIPQVRRSWQAIAVTPGIQGDRYWLIENADFGNFAADPNFVFTDPTVTPGRINSYEFIEDLEGQFDPCGLGISTSLTTLFDSNNAATGNMFDVTSNAGAIQVTGLDVNVDFDVGTQFTLNVLTTSGSFQGTITADPLCTFNCSFNASAWTPIASGVGTSQGRDAASFVDIDDFVLDGNSTTGIWVTLVRDGSIVDEFRYTNGSSEVGNADITISLGAGVVGPSIGNDETTVPNRLWNGTIYYNTR